MENGITTGSVTAATAIAYLIGSFPTAYLAAKSRGVDIYKVGTGQAGTTNIFREVSRFLAGVVFFTDSIKGLLALVIARSLGLHSEWLLVPGFAVILAHWNSPLAGFRGGDGVAALTGVGLGFAPEALAIPYTLVLVITGVLSLSKRRRHPSLWGAIAGYLAFLAVSFVPFFEMTAIETLGFTSLGVAILVHSYVYRRRRRGKLANALIEAVDDEDMQLPRSPNQTQPAPNEATDGGTAQRPARGA